MNLIQKAMENKGIEIEWKITIIDGMMPSIKRAIAHFINFESMGLEVEC